MSLETKGAALQQAAPAAASPPVRMLVREGVAFVTIDNPPANRLGPRTRRGLKEAFDRIADQPQLRAVIIHALGPHFSAGIDLREHELRPARGDATPDLASVCDIVEACPCPVVVALQGTTLGAGAELALAAHYRIAAPKSFIGFPDIMLGLLPVAGGTQRLPRLVGPQAALEMLLGGRSCGAAQAEKMGLIDAVIDGDLAAGAYAFATGLIAEAAGPRPTRALRDKMTDGAAWMRAVQASREAANLPLAAAGKMIDCIEAALLLRFPNGAAFERDAFAACLADPQSRALRHVFLAERRIGKSLLTNEDGQRSPAVPAGEAIVANLVGALDRAIIWLVGAGITEGELDRALLRYGFVAAPFGGAPDIPGAPADAAAVELDEAIMRRCVAALIAEGARLVEAGTAARPSDIDALAVHGLGFPRWRGGPMKAAQLDGLAAYHRDMTIWAADDPVWLPPRLVADAVNLAEGFDVLRLTSGVPATPDAAAGVSRAGYPRPPA